MKSMLSSLRDICTTQLIREKVIIVPTLSSGQQLVQAMARAGIPCLNLHVETISSLSAKLCKNYLYKKELSIVSRLVSEHLVMSILKTLSQSNGLRYFDKLEVTAGVSRAIYDAVLDMKMAGLGPDDIKADMFTNRNKGLDIQNVYQQYEMQLRSRSIVDRIDLINLAAQLIDDRNNNTLYVIPDSLDLKPVEKQLLNKVVAGNKLQVALSPAETINDVSLYIDGANSTDRLEMFQAYGENNELREVLRRIKHQRLAFEKISILYTSGEPYSQFCYDLAQKHNLPVTFGQGINIRNTRPGRLLFGFLDWVRSGYEVAKLYPLLTSGDLHLHDDDGINGFQAAKILRAIGIGWSRERYITQLQNEIDVLGKESSQVAGERLEIKRKQLEKVIALKDILVNLFTHIPQPASDDKVALKAFVGGLGALIDQYSATVGELDFEAKSLVIQQLSELESVAEEMVPVTEAVTLINDLVEGSRVGTSAPKPGFIHIDSYEKGIWVNRENNFIVGLDAQRFPGQAKEDPILLDIERQQLGELQLKKTHPRDKYQKMMQVLVSLSGKVTLSYSCCDPVENREVFPSSLLLQVFRLRSGDNSKDYADLLAGFTQVKGYIPPKREEAMDAGEWWLNNQVSKGKIEFESALKDFIHLQSGVTALRERLGQGFGFYDGQVTVDSNLTDPRKNKKLVLSSSQLEKLATCPYGYYLKYILRVEPSEDIEYDPGIWLDPASRGSLLHNIFERFYKDLAAQGEKPNLGEHEAYLYEIAGELLGAQSKLVPPPSDAVFEQECKEILDSCRVFLVSEEDQCHGVTPCHFELTFGFKAETNGESGQVDPVHIALPDGSGFFLRGKIDRVDKAEDQSFKVLDYKTGSTYSYSESNYYKGGRQLQHTLYAIAFEQLMQAKQTGETAQVKEGGYIFPTVRGEGKRILRSQNDREPLYDILQHLMNILATGTFAMTDNEEDCKFCDYQEICNRHIIGEAVVAKYDHVENNQLEFVRRLRVFE